MLFTRLELSYVHVLFSSPFTSEKLFTSLTTYNGIHGNQHSISERNGRLAGDVRDNIRQVQVLRNPGNTNNK